MAAARDDEEPQSPEAGEPAGFAIDDRVTEVVGTSSTILCIVALVDDDDLMRAQHGALELAARQGARLLLYDRGEETWGETDHSGPVDAEAIDLDASPHLSAAMEAADAAGVDVSVWRSTIPTIGTGILNAIQNGGVDVVVLPERGGVTSLTDRMLEGGRDLVGAVAAVLDKPIAADARADVPVVVVSETAEVHFASD